MKFLLLNVLFLFSLIGCSASFEGGTPTSNSKLDGFNDLVTGPEINGFWESSCVYVRSSDAYRKKSLLVEKPAIVRTDNTYTDKACTVVQLKSESKGIFRWLKETSYGGYQLEYKFDLGGGWSTFSKEEILLEDGKLFLSDFQIGFDSILKDMPLAIPGSTSSTPAPTPNPQTTKAEIVGGYDQAKYAFCSNQRMGVLIEFLNTDLSKASSGKARLGFKACGGTDPIEWTDEVGFTVIHNSFGQPNITFDHKTNITPYRNQSGLAGQSGAMSLMVNNSGECYFLKTAATKNIPFTYACE